MYRGKFLVALFALLMVGSSAMAATVSGEAYSVSMASAAIASATVRGIAGTGGVIQKRTAQLRAERKATVEQFGSNSAMASAYMNQNFANRIWVSTFYNNIDVDQKGSQVGSGYDYKAWGAALGYDHAFGDFTVGAAFTYSRGDYDAKGIHDDSSVDNYGVSVYGTYYNCAGFFGSLYGGYNYGDNDIKMRDAGRWAKGSPHSDSYWIGTELGYDFRVSESFTLTPTIGLLWMDSETSSYRIGGVRASSVDDKALLLPIDLAATYTHQLDDCSKIDLTVKGGYAYDFKNNRPDGVVSVGGISSAVRGVSPGHHNWNIGAGVKYSNERFDVGVDYRYDTRKRYDSHFVSATLGIKF